MVRRHSLHQDSKAMGSGLNRCMSTSRRSTTGSEANEEDGKVDTASILMPETNERAQYSQIIPHHALGVYSKEHLASNCSKRANCANGSDVVQHNDQYLGNENSEDGRYLPSRR